MRNITLKTAVDAVLQKGVAFCGATPFLVKNDGYPVSGRQMDK